MLSKHIESSVEICWFLNVIEREVFAPIRLMIDYSIGRPTYTPTHTKFHMPAPACLQCLPRMRLPCIA